MSEKIEVSLPLFAAIAIDQLKNQQWYLLHMKFEEFKILPPLSISCKIDNGGKATPELLHKKNVFISNLIFIYKIIGAAPV